MMLYGSAPIQKRGIFSHQFSISDFSILVWYLSVFTFKYRGKESSSFGKGWQALDLSGSTFTSFTGAWRFMYGWKGLVTQTVRETKTNRESEKCGVLSLLGYLMQIAVSSLQCCCFASLKSSYMLPVSNSCNNSIFADFFGIENSWERWLAWLADYAATWPRYYT